MRINQRIILLIINLALSICTAQTTIAVLDFQANGISKSEATLLTDRFRVELVSTWQYTVIERGQMEEILKEQGFQQSGCTTTECAVEVGNLLGAEQIIGGTIGKIGNVLTVSVRMIDVASGEIIIIAAYDHFGEIGELLTEGMKVTVTRLVDSKNTPTSSIYKQFVQTKSNTVFNDDGKTGTVTDIDGNVYKIVNISGQYWMAENLKVTRFRNGELIDNITSSDVWKNLTTSAYCNYRNKIDYAIEYGRLYNWYAVNDSRNIAPEGWHVPSDRMWKELEMSLGMLIPEVNDEGFRGRNVGNRLKDSTSVYWCGPNYKAINKSGFTAIPVGVRFGNGTFALDGSCTKFWSSTAYNDYFAWSRGLYSDSSKVCRVFFNKEDGFSVRCVKD